MDNYENELNNGEQTSMQSWNSSYTLESSPEYSGELQPQPTSPPRTSRMSLSETPRPSSNRNTHGKSSSSQQREQHQQQREELSNTRKRRLQIPCDVPIVTPQSESQHENRVLLKRIENLQNKIQYYDAKITDCEIEEVKMQSEYTLALAQAGRALAETSNVQARADKAQAEANLSQAQADTTKAEAEKAEAEAYVIEEKIQAEIVEGYITTLYAALPTVQKHMESLLH